MKRLLGGIALALTITAGIPAAIGNAGPTDHKVRAEGKDTFGLKFDMKGKLKEGLSSGQVLFETNSFGDQEGEVKCVFVDRRRAVLTGPLTDPPNGITDFVVVLRDRHRDGKGKRDKIATFMTGPKDCTTVGGEEPFKGSAEPIKKDKISVK